ncbi:CoA-binding domain-containing protein [Mycena indigotica]|uniref:CoA-binding domain-containing protein n=1 Tax=Mycena indigotica TaxID=2126181 RepID=A0A8H6VYQ4_9AGAR|nr:CoA-binding domain-containing protein [Mycena indigotica]KAF7299069.1 CoA-binding domain-containing protein [Mycena indigotica]
MYSTIQQKQCRFLSAPKYAVVGASNNTTKFGFQILKWLHERGKDVVSVNIKPENVLGLECYESLSRLPEPTHTAVVMVVPPKATLEVLQQAESLGIFAFWLEPGTEDEDVVTFIQANSALDDISLYDTPHAVQPLANGVLPVKRIGPPCSGIISVGDQVLDSLEKDALANPVKVVVPDAVPDQVEAEDTSSIPSSPVSDTSTTPTLIADNVVAGVKRPAPSRTPTPQPRKSLKLETSDLDKQCTRSTLAVQSQG